MLISTNVMTNLLCRFSSVDNMNCVDMEMQTIGRILSALPGITRCISI